MKPAMDDRSFHAYQAMVAAAKRYWATDLYGNLREEYEAGTTPGERAAATVADVAADVEGRTTYRYFAWFERHLQRMKYSGQLGLANYYANRRSEALDRLAEAGGEDILDLDPALKLPGYYTSIDTHQHPGGLWSDSLGGVIYEHGARTTTPLLGDDHQSLHTRFATFVKARCNPARVVDLACGFGKSTRPLIDIFPDAHVEGLDLSEPCLRVAAALTRPADRHRVRFRQRNAESPGLEAASVDLATSTMFLHEIPVIALRRVLRQTFELLAPGGTMVHLDFWVLPDPFTRFLHYGHGFRNNEPYMRPLAELDLYAELMEAGFREIEILPFSETGDAGADASRSWRFPWTAIVARKP